MELDALLERLLRAPAEVAPLADVHAWRSRHLDATAGIADPIARAALGAALADRLGYAFASGLCEALDSLLGRDGRARALCASEEGGAHPRAIRTALTPAGAGFRLTGDKRWSTLGTLAEELVVVARLPGERDGHPILACARVPSERAGVLVEPAPPPPFVPEIPHARVRFDAVEVAGDELLPGDGYRDLLRPFRTVEDIFVHAATLAWLTRIARRHAWPPEHLDQILALVAAAAGLAVADPSSPAVHRALAPVIAGTRALVEREDLWDRVEPETAARLRRDRPLLDVAARARARRLERARGSA